jgi:hypothetical protein
VTVLRGIIAEIVHLFVDDGALALALVVWSAIVGAGVGLVHDFVPIAGAALFAGCAAILLWNVIRAAKR